jgi:hypothetical protein
VIQGALTPPGERRKGEWLMKSVGPDNIDDRQSTAPGYILNARVYDPTNGTTSRGDIVTFSDISGTGKNSNGINPGAPHRGAPGFKFMAPRNCNPARPFPPRYLTPRNP